MKIQISKLTCARAHATVYALPMMRTERTSNTNTNRRSRNWTLQRKVKRLEHRQQIHRFPPEIISLLGFSCRWLRLLACCCRRYNYRSCHCHYRCYTTRYRNAVGMPVRTAPQRIQRIATTTLQYVYTALSPHIKTQLVAANVIHTADISQQARACILKTGTIPYQHREFHTIGLFNFNLLSHLVAFFTDRVCSAFANLRPLLLVHS